MRYISKKRGNNSSIGCFRAGLLSVGYRAPNHPGIFDRAAGDFGEGFFDEHPLAGVAADDRVGDLLDIANLVGVENKGLSIEASEQNHGSTID
jgi:hypothetical protein